MISMGSNSSKIELDHYSKEEIYIIRKRKLRNEIESAIRLLKMGIDPLKAADNLIHDAIRIMKDNISNKYPNLNEKQINQKIRENIILDIKFRKKRKKVSSDG